MSIKSPYNFVPLGDGSVYFPDWSDMISHDIPFSDGISGKIKLKITSESPIFIRNGHSGETGEINNPIEAMTFSKAPDGRYFIPGTSIKGAVRNVLEILSNGKMKMQRSLSFAQREWDNKYLYNLKNPSEQQKIKGGWLRWSENEGYYIIDCGKPNRISHEKIDDYYSDYFNTDRRPFEWYFMDKSNAKKLNKEGLAKFNLNKPFLYKGFSRNESGEVMDYYPDFKSIGNTFDPKTGVFKYALVDGLPLHKLTFRIDGDRSNEKRVKIDDDGDIEGTIVFTGQPDMWKSAKNRKINAGKFYEFVFRNPKDGDEKLLISEEKFKEYQSIYKDSPEWKAWSLKLYNEGIPVFFYDRDSDSKKAKDKNEAAKNLKWGMALLFKLPYDKTPYETLSEDHKRTDYDLAECIFGTTGDGNKSDKKSLKGRVSFGHAFCVNEAKELGETSIVLGTPKASYYPNYIEQKGTNGRTDKYKTYNDGHIAGWKRYMVRKSVFQCDTSNMNENLITKINPLDKGAKFETYIRFHNLRPIELGAIISALTFHNRENTCFYQLGQGKPYGYGKVRFSVELAIPPLFDKGLSKTDYMNLFEKELWRNKFIVNDAYIVEIAKSEVDGDKYEYMRMSNEREANEFNKAKENHEYLSRFNDEIAKSNIIQSRINMEESLSIEREEAKRKQDKLRNEIDKLRVDCEKMFNEKKYKEALAGFEKMKELKEALGQDTSDGSYVAIWINRCKTQIENEESTPNPSKLSFDEWIKTQKISSIPALKNNLKKWLDKQDRSLSLDETMQLEEAIKSKYSTLNNKEKKKWNNSLNDLATLVKIDKSKIIN